MRKLATALTLASVCVASLMVAPSLYAQGSRDSSNSMTRYGMMMDHRQMGDKSPTHGRGMMSMMKMMKQMNPMDHCGRMTGDDRQTASGRMGRLSRPTSDNG
jgi:hypothetical protein